jgi:predicted nucleic acid-binding protein
MGNWLPLLKWQPNLEKNYPIGLEFNLSLIKYQKFLETQIDSGEASAIALASEFDTVLLLLDDLKARKLANQLNFKITGTLGIIHKAKQMSIIDKVKPLIDKLVTTDFRIADTIIAELLKLNKE